MTFSAQYIDGPSNSRMLRRFFVAMLIIAGYRSSLFAIDYGTPVPEGSYPTVGMIVVNIGQNQTALGTGTLIDRNIVLTAAHVIQDAPSPGHITFSSVLGGKRLFQARVILYRTHQQYVNLRSDSLITDEERTYMSADTIDSSAADIALLLLDQSLPEEIPLFALAESPPKAGEEVTAVGYGLDESKKGGSPRKLKGTLAFLKEQDGALLFRTPSGSTQRTDHGDSGGPLLIKEGNTEKIAAITHGFFTSIKVDGLAPDEYGIYVSIAKHIDWIDTVKQELKRYKLPAAENFYLVRNNRRSPFMALTARQIFSLANADTPLDRLVNRIFSRGINEPIPADVAVGWQKRYNLPPGMLISTRPQ